VERASNTVDVVRSGPDRLGFTSGPVSSKPDGIRIASFLGFAGKVQEPVVGIPGPAAREETNVAAKRRCEWAASDPLLLDYHDTEWGTPEHDDRKLFEFLILDGAQAGLSWLTILRKRENYRRAFDRFDPARVAKYDARKVRSLLTDDGIVRNRLKIRAAVTNAREVLTIQKEFGSFDAYIWRFVGGRPKTNRWTTLAQIPARTEESDAMSRALRERGFGFVGSTICYAYMQAVGMVNDHVIQCFRHREVGRNSHRRGTDNRRR